MKLSDIVDFLIDLFSHRARNVRRKTLPIKDQEFAVIGLGRFGSSLAQTLVGRGHTVLGIDRDPDLAQQFADEITQTLSFDTTDQDALRDIGITSFDTVVVAVGTNFEANIMTTVALKALGVKVVICKAATQRQRDILVAVGADRVVLPEHESGAKLAQELSTPGIVDQIRLSGNVRISELKVPVRMSGLTIGQAGIEDGLYVVAVVRGENTTVCPDSSFRLQTDDLVAVVGEEEDITRLLVK